MMNKLANYIVKHRVPILLLTLVLTVVSAFMIPRVKINSDMTEYLPDTSKMKIGMDIMAEQLPDATEDQYLRVMLTGLDEDARLDAKAAFEELPYVKAVEYEARDEDYNKGDKVLYRITTEYEYDSAEERAIQSAVKELYPDNDLIIETGSTFYKIPTWVIALALGSLLVILFIMTPSWVEPLLFMATIGAAVILNSGTNIFRGTVSNTTFAISAILQMVLSMDYSIIIMNRYRQESETESDHAKAMVSALKNAFSSVTSSAFTTFVGLLMLVFMSFKIGPDLGIVLAKGVIFSLLCVFLMLPALIIMCDGAIRKTQKKVPTVPTKKLAVFSYKARVPMFFVCILLMAAATFLQSKTEFSFDLSNESVINDTFTENNPVIVLYHNFDDRRVEDMCDEFSDTEGIEQIASYPTTIGKQLTAAELEDALNDMGGDLSVEPEMIRTVYALRYADHAEHRPSLGGFVEFAAEQPALEEYAQDMENLPALAGNAGLDLNKEMSLDGMYSLISTAGFEIDKAQLELLYAAYQGENNLDEAWTMSIDEFIDFVNTRIAENESFSEFVDEDVRKQLADAEETLADARKQLRGEDYSIIAFSTVLPKESEETTEFVNKLDAECEEKLLGSYYLIGTSAMYHEMQQDFRGEVLLLTLLTAISIFIIVLISFRNLLVPTVLVLLVQCAVFMTAAFSYIRGYAMNYMAYLIVQCILMGATIDYGILFVNYYRENRHACSVQDSLIRAYDGSIHTIMTSGLIVILVTGLLGVTVSAPAIGPICATISLGSLSSVLLILFVLPAITAALDKFVMKKH